MLSSASARTTQSWRGCGARVPSGCVARAICQRKACSPSRGKCTKQGITGARNWMHASGDSDNSSVTMTPLGSLSNKKRGADLNYGVVSQPRTERAVPFLQQREALNEH